MTGFSLAQVDALINGRIGRFDVVCPLCSQLRKRENQHRRTLRIWRQPDGFATYACAHCGAKGYAHGGDSIKIDEHALAQARARRDERDRGLSAMSREKARSLWLHSKPIESTPAEVYIREVRGYAGPLPPTLAYLEPLHGYPTAMIGVFGMVREIAVGTVCIETTEVVGVHLTLLKVDGSGKAGTGRDKLTLGRDHTMPIVLAPPNDLLGLAIAEGIEDTLSIHQATGLGCWAAGSASRLPMMAQHVPDYVECVSISVDDDDAGRRNSEELAMLLRARGFEVRMVRSNVRSE